MSKENCLMKVFVFVTILLMSSTAFAEVGVTATEIFIGQSCALEGPAGSLGTGMSAGLNAYFAQVNAAGGINGRKIRLVSINDGYEPQKAIDNTRKLIETDQVFALIGEVGTPTSKAVLPVVEKAGVPFFGPFTGAEFLRTPYKDYVVNVRASYYQEMEAHAANLVDNLGLKKVACFYQNDGYGQAGLAGIKKALAARGMELVATGTYERNTVAVKGGLMQIRKSKPDAVVMVGAYKPCAEFIKLAKKVGMKDQIYCNISFVGTKALHAELGDQGEGCIVSQVVPFPSDESIPLVKEFAAAMAQHQPDQTAGFVSLEGYMVGKLFCQAAAQAGANLNRGSFLKAIASVGAFDLGGITLHYSGSDNQGMDKVFLTVIKDGKVVPYSSDGPAL